MTFWRGRSSSDTDKPTLATLLTRVDALTAQVSALTEQLDTAQAALRRVGTAQAEDAGTLANLAERAVRAENLAGGSAGLVDSVRGILGRLDALEGISDAAVQDGGRTGGQLAALSGQVGALATGLAETAGRVTGLASGMAALDFLAARVGTLETAAGGRTSDPQLAALTDRLARAENDIDRAVSVAQDARRAADVAAQDAGQLRGEVRAAANTDLQMSALHNGAGQAPSADLYVIAQSLARLSVRLDAVEERAWNAGDRARDAEALSVMTAQSLAGAIAQWQTSDNGGRGTIVDTALQGFQRQIDGVHEGLMADAVLRTAFTPVGMQVPADTALTGNVQSANLSANVMAAVTASGANLALGAGQKAGFYGTTPPVQQSVTVLTNNVTSGGTANQLDNFTDLATYATDAAAIRNNIYQLGEQVNQLRTAIKNYGLLA